MTPSEIEGLQLRYELALKGRRNAEAALDALRKTSTELLKNRRTAEYLEDIRMRLNLAHQVGSVLEVTRLQKLMFQVMKDGDATGQPMPWDVSCPLCGHDLPATPTP